MHDYEITFRRDGETHQYVVTREGTEDDAIYWAESMGTTWYVLCIRNVFGEFRRLI